MTSELFRQFVHESIPFIFAVKYIHIKLIDRGFEQETYNPLANGLRAHGKTSQMLLVLCRGRWKVSEYALIASNEKNSNIRRNLSNCHLEIHFSLALYFFYSIFQSSTVYPGILDVCDGLRINERISHCQRITNLIPELINWNLNLSLFWKQIL